MSIILLYPSVAIPEHKISTQMVTKSDNLFFTTGIAPKPGSLQVGPTVLPYLKFLTKQATTNIKIISEQPLHTEH